jgi:hypothetical protein
VVRKRNDLFGELNRRKLFGFAVEIGVAEGGYSFYLLDNWHGICYQVDPWQALTTEEYRDYNNVEQQEQDRRFNLVQETAKKYNGRAIPVRDFSKVAVERFPDDYFNFVYIDANHKYEFIKEDLHLWYPKCKSGGIFAGHDYLDGVITSGDYGVKSAVDEFAKEQGFQINVTHEPDYPSWWTIKP